jgi:hypothetical protein
MTTQENYQRFDLSKIDYLMVILSMLDVVMTPACLLGYIPLMLLFADQAARHQSRRG